MNCRVQDFRHRSCCLKIRYKDLRGAQHDLGKLAARYNDQQPLHAYYCIFCNDFHCGRKPKTKTLKVAQDIARLLAFDFHSPCTICGKSERFIQKQPFHEMKCPKQIQAETDH